MADEAKKVNAVDRNLLFSLLSISLGNIVMLSLLVQYYLRYYHLHKINRYYSGFI
jgi:hypothetical protein